MDNKVVKYTDFVKENLENAVDENRIREFFNDECDELITNLFSKMASEFPLKDKKVSKDQTNDLNDIKEKLVELCIDVTIENMPDFKPSWENEEDVIEVGDTVYDNESGDEIFVSKLGQNNNFYDHENKRYVNFNDVTKKSKND